MSNEKKETTTDQTRMDQTVVIGEDGQNADLASGTKVFEYLKAIYEGQKLSKAYKDQFSALLEVEAIKTDELSQLLVLADERDKQNKILLALSEFLLENYGSIKAREQLISYIEYCFSNEGSLSRIKNNTQLQHWVSQSDVTNKLDFVYLQIDSLWKRDTGEDTRTPLPEAQKNLLKCVAAIWLYYKNHVSVDQVVAKLSKDAFEVNRSVPGQIERRALAFVAKMLVSTNREGFSYFMNYVNQQISNIRTDARNFQQARAHAETRIRSMSDRLDSLAVALRDKEETIEQLTARISSLEQSLVDAKKEKTHQNIHHNTQRSVDQANINAFLTESVLPNLKAALAANSRTPPKSERVAKLLSEIQDSIEDRGE